MNNHLHAIRSATTTLKLTVLGHLLDWKHQLEKQVIANHLYEVENPMGTSKESTSVVDRAIVHIEKLKCVSPAAWKEAKSFSRFAQSTAKTHLEVALCSALYGENPPEIGQLLALLVNDFDYGNIEHDTAILVARVGQCPEYKEFGDLIRPRFLEDSEEDAEETKAEEGQLD